MYELIKSFVSFDKLMKEKLVGAFFWLGLIVILLTFFSDGLSAVKLGPLAGLAEFFNFFVRLLLAIVSLRLLCESAIALFRINDNVSPDGGRAETADMDPVYEARRVAEEAARKARMATSQVVSRSKTGETKVEVKSKGANMNLKSSATKAKPSPKAKASAPSKPAMKKAAAKPAKATAAKAKPAAKKAKPAAKPAAKKK